jgi:inosine-uridine nucleoside N-ribohydrolase
MAAVCGCEQRQRAFVLDTDFGWDPDDILALFVLFQLRGDSPVAVISNSELPGEPRARAIRGFLHLLGAGAITVCAGASSQLPEPFVSDLAVAVASTSEPIGGLMEIQEFMKLQQSAGRAVVWIGIGAMTNIANVLSSDECHRPDCIVQQGASVYGAATNIRLDPTAACSVLSACERLFIPLTVLASDTTRWGLVWQDDGPAYTSPLAAELHAHWSSHAALSAAIAANAGPRGYSYGSSLHDPLTVVAALDGCHGCGALPEFVPASRSRLTLDADGCISRLCVPEGTVACRVATVLSVGSPCAAATFWTQKSQPTRFFHELSAGDTGNCTLSIGPLLPSEVDVFCKRLKEALSAS